MTQQVQQTDAAHATVLSRQLWRDCALPCLMDYVRIPNKSPMFDPRWADNGYMEQAAALLESWCRARDLPGLQTRVLKLPERTPLLLAEYPGQVPGPPILIYGHFDKQPEMSGWADQLGPWKPVLRADRLYGRGAADDGYALFAAIIALQILQQQAIPHGSCIILIEGSEESGSPDLPAYLEALAELVGTPRLMVCLDSGCGDYLRLWHTTSLRGLIGGDLHIEMLSEGVHSGDAGGIVPTPFQVLRLLLDRLEDAGSGQIRDARFQVLIPPQRRAQARAAAQILGEAVRTRFPFSAAGTGAGADADAAEHILNRTWRAALAITGADGLPALENAGNVLLPHISVRLALRLPPTCPAGPAMERLRGLLETEPPFGASVRFEPGWQADGWHAPELPHWLEEALERASQRYFGAPAAFMGEGGSIPFLPLLQQRFGHTPFMVTGVLGPQANAHGPNEFLHLPTAERLSCCLAEVLAAGAADTIQ